MLMADEALAISAKLRLDPSEIWDGVRNTGQESDSVGADEGVGTLIAMLPA